MNPKPELEITSPPIELRSEEMDEILGKTPNSIIRWGITIIFSLVLLVMIIGWFVKYPDTLKAEITLNSENMPVTLVAKTNGKINKIFVQANQTIVSGSILMLIENTAKYEDVIALQSINDSIKPYYIHNKIL